MTETMLLLIEDWGVWAVLLAMFIEGSAFPFFGTIFVLTLGFVVDLSWIEIGIISLLGSLLYALGSYILYFIGYKVSHIVENRLNPAKKESLEKAKGILSRYGVYSVAILSPLHLGNVVPFLAGTANMNLRLYTLLTMLGIAPATFLLLSIGHFYNGTPEELIEMISNYQTLLIVGLGIIAVVYLCLKWHRRWQDKNAL